MSSKTKTTKAANVSAIPKEIAINPIVDNTPKRSALKEYEKVIGHFVAITDITAPDGVVRQTGFIADKTAMDELVADFGYTIGGEITPPEGANNINGNAIIAVATNGNVITTYQTQKAKKEEEKMAEEKKNKTAVEQKPETNNATATPAASPAPDAAPTGDPKTNLTAVVDGVVTDTTHHKVTVVHERNFWKEVGTAAACAAVAVSICIAGSLIVNAICGGGNDTAE